MIEPSQFKFGIVTKLADGEGEIALDGATLAFRLADQLTPFELLPYRWEHETQAYELPEVGEVVLIVQDDIGTVRWTWPQLVLRSEAGKAVLRQYTYDQPVLYSGLYIAYHEFSTEEDAAAIKMCGSAEFPRGPVYIGFRLDKIFDSFPGIPLEICRYNPADSRITYVGRRRVDAFVG